ncbi:hypothetical protein D3C78_1352100 [compost metagenome]
MGARYMLIVPPYGVSIPYMPSYAQQIWVGAVPYFFAAGNYYIWQPDSQTYQAVAPPQTESTTLAESSYDVVAYPESGQAPEQQDRDRYECHRWAVDESDFDRLSRERAGAGTAGSRSLRVPPLGCRRERFRPGSGYHRAAAGGRRQVQAGHRRLPRRTRLRHQLMVSLPTTSCGSACTSTSARGNSR